MMEDESMEVTVPAEAEVRIFATWDRPAPHWHEVTGTNGAPAYRGRCNKKVYRTFTHAAADARRLRIREGHSEAYEAYWCRRRGFHVGRPGGSRHERVVEMRPLLLIRAA